MISIGIEVWQMESGLKDALPNLQNLGLMRRDETVKNDTAHAT